MAVKVPERPYPTIGEIYRCMAVALGTKDKNPDVDQMARRGDYDFRLREKLLIELFYEPLQQQAGEPFALLFCQCTDHLLSEYVKLVNRVPLDAMTRRESLPLLIEHFFSRYASDFFTLLHKKHNGPNSVSYFSADNSNVLAVACEWLEANVASFPAFLKSQEKIRQDQYRKWKQRKELPKAGSFSTFLSDFPESSDKKIIIIHLTVARALQFLINMYSQYDILGLMKNALWEVKPHDMGVALSLAHIKSAEKFAPIREAFVPAFTALQRTTKKDAASQKVSKALLVEFEKTTEELDPTGVTRHFIEWLKARWFVFSGEYKLALQQYEVAFQNSIYRAGNTPEILKEALAVAAKERNRTLMKRLKNQAIAFGAYDLPDYDDKLSNASGKSKIHVVEDWEIEQWNSAFAHLFRPENCFPECIDEEKHRGEIPFVHYVEEKHFLREPDLVNPNRRIDVGISIGGEKRRYPQLIWHTDQNHPHHVESLLKAGAKVDQLSDTSDSALLLATIEVVNTGDRRCFDLLKDHSHKQETMNMRTDKKKRTVLLEAIETGQPDIVETVLDMGAEVDRRGHTDHSTALNQCIKYIGNMTSPSQVLANMLNFNPDDPVVIDTVRRSAHGMMGLTDAEVRKNLIRLAQGGIAKDLHRALAKNHLGQQQKRFEYKKLLQIAHMLLEKSADPNAVHSSPIHGYTPLMLAVELDESELVQRMLEKGGDPYQTYRHGSYYIDCWIIAREFRSVKALATLRNHNR